MAEKIIIVTPATQMTKIQEYLKRSGYTIRFIEGVHNITKTLFLYSNTNIILDKGAILVRKNPSHIFRGFINPSMNYNYNAVQNITISGQGTLKGDGLKKVGSVFGFMHGQNITIRDIKIKNVYKSHAIDLSACKDITIKNVEFSGRIIDPKNNYKEEIQIDYSMSAGFPYFNKNSKCYNDNHCENVNIIGCRFNDANFCIGTHTETNSTKQHKNIQILDCLANGCVFDGDGMFAKIINIDTALIKGNIIKGFSRAIVVTSCNKFYNSHGVKYNQKPNGKTGCKHITLEDNNISNAAGNVKAAGIYVASQFDDLLHSDITIRNNKLRLNNINAQFDVYISKSDGVTILDNDTVLDVYVNKSTTNKITWQKPGCGIQ